MLPKVDLYRLRGCFLPVSKCWRINQSCFFFSRNNVNVGGTGEPCHDGNKYGQRRKQIRSFACTLLTNNHMTHILQFGIN